jgi:cobaltochelatase CobT
LHILRGEADAVALRLRYNNATTYNRQRPIGGNSAELFDIAEQARVEALGSQVLAGVAKNLEDYHEACCKDKGYHLVTEREESQIADAVGMLLRERLSGKPSPDSAQPLMATWRSWLEDKAGKRINGLKDCLHDQEKFGESIRNILEDLDLPAEFEGDGDGEQGEEKNQENSDDQDQQDGDDSEQDSEQDDGDSEDMDFDGLDPDALDDMEDIGDESEDTEEDPSSSMHGQPQRPEFGDGKVDSYRAFTLAHDETILA